MTPPGYLRASGVIAAKDLRLEWRTWESLSSSLVFSLIVLVIFNFAFGVGAVNELGAERLVPGAIWIALAFAAVVGMARSMHLERRGDTATAVALAPVDRGALFTGKFVANLAKFTMLQWIVVPLAAIFFGFDLRSAGAALILVLFLHGLGLCALGTLFAAVVSRVGRGEALLATLLLPACTPLFLSAVSCTAALLEGKGLGSVTDWLKIAIGFDVLYFLVALATFEFVLEE